MDLESLTSFFMWCTIINGDLFVVSTLFTMATPDLVYRIQAVFFPLKKEQFQMAMWAFLGGFKILWLMFNGVPFIALLIIA